MFAAVEWSMSDRLLTAYVVGERIDAETCDGVATGED